LTKYGGPQSHVALATKCFGDDTTKEAFKKMVDSEALLKVKEAIGKSLVSVPLRKQSLSEIKMSKCHETLLRGQYPSAKEIHGLMDKVVYFSRTLDLEAPDGKMILMHKSLYGMKQTGNIWHAEWKASMTKIGFRQSKYDPCLWVDDEIFTHDLPKKTLDEIIKETQKLGFVLSSMDNMEYYIGTKIDFDGQGKVKMSQKAYLDLKWNVIGSITHAAQVKSYPYRTELKGPSYPSVYQMRETGKPNWCLKMGKRRRRRTSLPRYLILDPECRGATHPCANIRMPESDLHVEMDVVEARFTGDLLAISLVGHQLMRATNQEEKQVMRARATTIKDNESILGEMMIWYTMKRLCCGNSSGFTKVVRTELTNGSIRIAII